jgi:hypothetical protein
MTADRAAEEAIVRADAAVFRRATCARPGCGRPIIAPVTGGRPGWWVHLSPLGATNRACKGAAFDDPKPCDAGPAPRTEWLTWPRNRARSVAYPGRAPYPHTDYEPGPVVLAIEPPPAWYDDETEWIARDTRRGLVLAVRDSLAEVLAAMAALDAPASYRLSAAIAAWPVTP